MKEELTKQDLQILSQVLYSSPWNGEQWNKIVTPLINKLAKMLDGMEEKKVDEKEKTPPSKLEK